MEEWRIVADFPQYMVSNLGRVKSLPREAKGSVKYKISEKILKTTVNNKGYEWVNLYDGPRKKSVYVHRLVAEAFIPNPEDKPCIDHVDTNPLNNRVDNLHWVTQKENLENPISKERRMNAVKRACGTDSFRIKMSKIISDMNKNEAYREKKKSTLIETYKNPEMRRRCVERNTQKKCVEHLSPNKTLLCTYASTGEAARCLGVSQTLIWSYINGRLKPKDKTIWRYKDEVDNSR